MWSIKCVICMFFDVLTRGVKTRGSGNRPLDWGYYELGPLWQTVSPSQTHFHLLSFMCCCLFEVLEYTNSVVQKKQIYVYQILPVSFFFPDHLRSSEVYQIENLLRFFELWKVELKNQSTTMRWSREERWPRTTRGGTIKKRTSPYSFDLGHNKRILANLISDNFSPQPKITKNTEERVQKVLFLIRETRICEFEGGPVRFKSKQIKNSALNLKVILEIRTQRI